MIINTATSGGSGGDGLNLNSSTAKLDLLSGSSVISSAQFGTASLKSTDGLTGTWVQRTISASNWNQSTKVYSLESIYPSSSYDILDILPNENTTDAQKKAWAAANCAGYYSTNIFKAAGDVPTIDIVVSVLVRAK